MTEKFETHSQGYDAKNRRRKWKCRRLAKQSKHENRNHEVKVEKTTFRVESSFKMHRKTGVLHCNSFEKNIYIKMLKKKRVL